MNVENSSIDRSRIQDAFAGNDRALDIRIRNARKDAANVKDAKGADETKADGWDRTDINPIRLKGLLEAQQDKDKGSDGGPDATPSIDPLRQRARLTGDDSVKTDGAKETEGTRHARHHRGYAMRLRHLFGDNGGPNLGDDVVNAFTGTPGDAKPAGSASGVDRTA